MPPDLEPCAAWILVLVCLDLAQSGRRVDSLAPCTACRGYSTGCHRSFGASSCEVRSRQCRLPWKASKPTCRVVRGSRLGVSEFPSISGKTLSSGGAIGRLRLAPGPALCFRLCVLNLNEVVGCAFEGATQGLDEPKTQSFHLSVPQFIHSGVSDLAMDSEPICSSSPALE